MGFGGRQLKSHWLSNQASNNHDPSIFGNEESFSPSSIKKKGPLFEGRKIGKYVKVDTRGKSISRTVVGKSKEFDD